MAQADYVVANQTFPNTRSEINTIFQAVVSNNAGNSAPSDTFANQWWFDSDGDKLYMRNKDNDAWVEILTIGATSDDVQSLFANVIAEGTSATGVTVDGVLLKDGQVDLADSKKILLGDGDDLEIYHDASNSNIQNNTGSLVLRSSSYKFQNSLNSETLIRADENDGVDLYFDNSKKFETTATGITVHDSSNPKITVRSNDGTSASVKLQRTNENDVLTDFELKNDGGSFKIKADNASQNEFDLFKATPDEVIFYSANSEKARINATGLGIGTTNPNHKLTISSGNIAITDDFGIYWGGNANNRIFGSDASDYLRFYTNGVERLRIDSGGGLLMGTTNASPAETNDVTGTRIGANGGCQFSCSGIVMEVNRDNSEGTAIGLRQAGATRGTIAVHGATASFNTSSDYRLKENVSYDWNATTKLKQLKPAQFNWISDETNSLIDGFIAHEAQTVVPYSVFGEKDAMDSVYYNEEDEETQGDTPSKNVGDFKEYSSTEIYPQQIDHSKLVPLLVKTIQELEARITSLES